MPQQNMTRQGNFAVIAVDADKSIWFEGVRPSQLTAANFLFVA